MQANNYYTIYKSCDLERLICDIIKGTVRELGEREQLELSLGEN